MEYIIIILLIINLVFLYFFWQRQGQQEQAIRVLLEEQEDHLSDQLEFAHNATGLGIGKNLIETAHIPSHRLHLS